MQNPIVIITGPTASGKTALSFDLAREFGGEIIAADSMTVYRDMDIGTDKPTLSDPNVKREDSTYIIKGIKHHLIDILDPDEDLNAAVFKEKTKEKIAEIQKRGNIPFIVGGSTLYIDAFVYDYSFPPVKPDEKMREKLEKKDASTLFKELVRKDPDAQWTVDPNNKRRIIRALEVINKTGKPYTKQQKKKSLPPNICYLAISKDRRQLYDNINRRVDQMVENGFLKEVKTLFKKYDHNTAMQAAGYKQLSEYLDGKTTKEDAVFKTKQVHRNFAKRQLTWLRRNRDVIWIKGKNQAEEEIKRFLG